MAYLAGIFVALLLFCAVVALLAWIVPLRAYIYDFVSIHLTQRWYFEVLKRLDDNTTLLDVGIGTGTSLLRHKDLIVKKNLRIVGVDYDKHYLEQCIENIKRCGLENRVTVFHESIYDYNTMLSTHFDAVYFSGSFMILPDQIKALTHCHSMLKNRKNGIIYFTQTFEEKTNAIMEMAKPLLKFVTTIDFGRITYMEQFLAVIEQAKLKVVENTCLGGGQSRSYRLIAV